MLRTFLAMEVSATVVGNARRVIQKLAEVRGPTVRWVEPEQMHITLKFFGDVAPELTSDICRATQRVLDESAPFEYEVAGVGAFPNLERPRTIWAGVGSGADAIRDLAERLEESMLPLGFPQEHRVFRPHLTLGRVKGRGDMRPLSEQLGAFNVDETFGVTAVDELLLLSSELSPRGPQYTRLATLELG